MPETTPFDHVIIDKIKKEKEKKDKEEREREERNRQQQELPPPPTKRRDAPNQENEGGVTIVDNEVDNEVNFEI